MKESLLPIIDFSPISTLRCLFSIDSNSKRLGAKLFDGQLAKAGAIIYKQRGTRIHPGLNVKRGGDDTLFATADGVVQFGERMNRKIVSVVPVEEAKA